MARNTGKVREFCQSGKVGTLLHDEGTFIHFQSHVFDKNGYER